MIGKTLGSYRIVEQIGTGGMATVYKAYDPDTDRYVALKILPPHLWQDSTFKERFNREAKAIAKLEHLHIIPIFAYGEASNVAYMAMRYLPVGTLTDRIKQGPLPFANAGLLLTQIAGALDYAHSHGVLHRDIKPSNVLLDDDGNAYLTDFGIAKMVEVTVDLTAGNILGTPAYMSPEQCQGTKEVTAASDIYSLGIVLYEMVTGRTPFHAETPLAIIYKHLHEPLPLPQQLRPNLPNDAQGVILKALSKAPEARYANCNQMATAFAAAIRHAPEATALEAPTLLSSRTGTANATPNVTEPQSTDTPTAADVAPGKFPVWGWAVAGLLLLFVAVGIGWSSGFVEFNTGEAATPATSAGPTLAVAGTPTEPATARNANDSGAVLFEDDFDDTPSRRWQFFPEQWPVEAVDNRTVLHNVPSMELEYTSGAELHGTDWGDYTVQFDFRFLKPDRYDEHYIYVRTRYGPNCPPTIASTNSYVVLISPDLVELRKETCKLEGKQPTLAGSDRNFDVDGWHTLQLTAVGNRIVVLIDGVEHINFVDDVEPHLGSDVVVETGNNVEFLIDNFRVTAVSPADEQN